MELVKITDVTNQLGLSSRSLRYYEQVGLIASVRPEFEKYRFYDADNMERLKQIIVLRKMQIPIKDILRIYQDERISTVVEVFVERINAIDEEANALAELKRIVSEFLQTMIQNGITKISALPLLYDEMDKQLETLEEYESVTFDELAAVSERLAKPLEPAIIALPAMRVLVSYLKETPQTSDTEGFWRWVQTHGLPTGHPGQHERFDFQTEAGDAMMLRLPEDFANDSDYRDATFPGGLFASVHVYLDEDLAQCFHTLIKHFDDNQYYEVDYTHDGTLRHPAMMENLISPDAQRELVSLLLPVKKRLPNPALFDSPQEIPPDAITIEEIEAQNPVLWAVDVPLDKMTPINGPRYEVLENGEVVYESWLMRMMICTNINVRLPFRVDIDFRMENEEKTAATSKSSIICYQDDDVRYLAGSGVGNRGFGINTGNDENRQANAISFHQPIYQDDFTFPGRCHIRTNEINRVTWIVGARHLAVIINGEVRYCGTNFPYMSLDLTREASGPIGINSNGSETMFFKSIRVSQLADAPKNKPKEGALIMITKQSNNLIPNIHRLVTDEHGENYWFNGSARYVMESLGEPDCDYAFFAGLTGDVFTQHYARGASWDAANGYHQIAGDTAFYEGIFAKCGYASTLVLTRDLLGNKTMYVQTLISYIDKGIPVLFMSDGPQYGVFVGYEEHGDILLYISGNSNEPGRLPLEDALAGGPEASGWLFVGEKKEQKDLARIYREAIVTLPQLLTTSTEAYWFGPAAFRTWAADIAGGRFDGMKPEDFDEWPMHTNFVCVLATNGSCCHGFLDKARELNPDMGFLEEVSRLYKRTADIWNNDNGEDLEALGGGFNVTLEALQDKEKREKIAAKICECGDVIDEVVRVISENVKDQLSKVKGEEQVRRDDFGRGWRR